LRLRVRAIVFPTIILLVLAVIPNVLVGLVPAEAVEMLRQVVQVDLRGMVVVVASLGVALAALSFLKNTWEKWSWVHLGSSLASEGGWLFLWLLLLGVGDPSCLGRITRALEITALAAAQGTLVVDLRFFAFFLIVIAGLTVVNILLTFNVARRSRSEPPAPPVHPLKDKPLDRSDESPPI